MSVIGLIVVTMTVAMPVPVTRVGEVLRVRGAVYADGGFGGGYLVAGGSFDSDREAGVYGGDGGVDGGQVGAGVEEGA
jgi:hypothetical protein